MPKTLKPIPGCDGYFACDDGTILSVKRKGGNDRGASRIGPPRIMKSYGDARGYLQVSLDIDGKVVTRKVHDLVLSAFIGPRPDGHDACHYPDSNPANNRLTNLRWDTHAENVRDRFRGRDRAAEKRCTRCGTIRLLSEFYFDKRSSDGRKSHCKACHIGDSISTRDIERKRASNREYMRRVRAKSS
jgi:hypothetical protein